MKYYFSWSSIFGRMNLSIVIGVALIMPAIFTYTIPTYWVNVLGIAVTTLMLQIIGKAIYTVWIYFTK